MRSPPVRKKPFPPKKNQKPNPAFKKRKKETRFRKRLPLININTLNTSALICVYSRRRVADNHITRFPGVLVAHATVVHKRVYNAED